MAEKKTETFKPDDCVRVAGRTATGEVREVGKGRNAGQVRVTFPDATTSWVDAGTIAKVVTEDENAPSRHDDDDLPKGKEARAEAIAARRADADREAMPNQIRNVGVLAKPTEQAP